MAYHRVHLYPAGVERDYSRQLLAYVSDIHNELNKRMTAMDILRVDGWSDDLTALIAALIEWALAPGQTAVIRLPDLFASVNAFNDRQWVLQVGSGTGIKLPPSNTVPAIPGAAVSTPQAIQARFGLGVDVYRNESWLVPVRDNWIAENTRLIKTIPQQYLNDVEGVIRRGVAQGLASKELAKQVEEQFGVTKRRAQIIARDQISKSNSLLTEYRHKDLGIDEYFWMDSEDARVRPLHRRAGNESAAGKTFKYSAPPSYIGANPGMPVLCRCWARAKWPDAPK